MPEPRLTLADLAADPARARDVAPEKAVALLVELAAVQSAHAALQAALAARALAATSMKANAGGGEPEDRLLTAEEVAERLGMTVRMVYRRACRWPFTRKLSPKALRFSERGVSQLIAATKKL